MIDLHGNDLKDIANGVPNRYIDSQDQKELLKTVARIALDGLNLEDNVYGIENTVDDLENVIALFCSDMEDDNVKAFSEKVDKLINRIKVEIEEMKNVLF